MNKQLVYMDWRPRGALRMVGVIDLIVICVLRRIEHVVVNAGTCNLSYGIIVITKAIKARFGKHFVDVLDCIRLHYFVVCNTFIKCANAMWISLTLIIKRRDIPYFIIYSHCFVKLSVC